MSADVILIHDFIKELMMTIYQVLDEQNNPIVEYSDLNYALRNAESLTFWHEDHYYHVEEIKLAEHHSQ